MPASFNRHSIKREMVHLCSLCIMKDLPVSQIDLKNREREAFGRVDLIFLHVSYISKWEKQRYKQEKGDTDLKTMISIPQAHQEQYQNPSSYTDYSTMFTIMCFSLELHEFSSLSMS